MTLLGVESLSLRPLKYKLLFTLKHYSSTRHFSDEAAIMVLAKSKNTVGLGNSLMNDRFGKGKGQDRKKVSAGIHRTGEDGQTVGFYAAYIN